MEKIKQIIKNKFILLTIFAIAMAFLETTVVVYLRKLYYAQGFAFPLNPLFPAQLLTIEWLREISTIIMLVCIAIIAGEKFNERFAYFLYSFAIWDIFYYIWLKLTLNWPASLLTWDLLFLIPVPWVGPVLAPIICSLTMIMLALCLVYFPEKKINIYEWFLILGGAFIIFISFIWDYSKLIIQNNLFSEFFNLATNQNFQQIVSQFTPSHFNWYLFLIGEILILCMLVLFVKKKN